MTESIRFAENSRKSLDSPPLKKDSFHFKANKIVPIINESHDSNPEGESLNFKQNFNEKAVNFNEKAVNFIKEIKECSQEDISEEDDNENLRIQTNSSPNSQSSGKSLVFLLRNKLLCRVSRK